MDISDYSPLVHERPAQSATNGIPIGKLLCGNRLLLGLLCLAFALGSIFCFTELGIWTEISDMEARTDGLVQEAEQVGSRADRQQQAADAQWQHLRKEKAQVLAASQKQNVTQGLLTDEFDALEDMRTALDGEDAAAEEDQDVLSQEATELQSQQTQFWAEENRTVAALTQEQDAVDQLYAIDEEQKTSLDDEKVLINQLADDEGNLTSVKDEMEREKQQQGKEDQAQQQQAEQDNVLKKNQELLGRAQDLRAQKGSLKLQEADMTDQEKALCEEEVKLYNWKRGHPELWTQAGAGGVEGAELEAVRPECDFKMNGETVDVPPDEMINILKGALDQFEANEASDGKE